VLLVRLAIGTARAGMVIRGAMLGDGMLVSDRCAVPVTMGFLRPKVILPDTWHEWPPEQLAVVLAHEGAHARRRDALVQWLALLNRAIFWFHPLAWWLERRLAALAEEACDDVVLERGTDPAEYAKYLVETARSLAGAGVRVDAWGMSMHGSSLSRRIGLILERGRVPRVSRPRLVCAVVACAITSVLLASGTLQRQAAVPALPVVRFAPPAPDRVMLMAQAKQRPAPAPQPSVVAPRQALESATVTLNTSNVGLNGISGKGGARILPNGLVEIRDVPLPNIIMEVYGAKGINFWAYGIRGPRPPAGKQDWCMTDRYDITAQMAPGTSEVEAHAMLQRLLEVRFKLKTHVKEEMIPAYDLVVAEGGPKIQRSSQPGPRHCDWSDGSPGLRRRECTNITMDTLAQELTGWGIDGPVINATELQGEYDLSFEMRPIHRGWDSPDVVAAALPTAFEAMRQLGLKLEPRQRTLGMIIVDHIEPLGWQE
jgi:bla regulator protein BlaR1